MALRQALQEIANCKATISNALGKINEIEKEIEGGVGSNAVYLTKAEYEALPDSKLSDDVEYRITDANTSNKFSSTDVTYGNGTVKVALDSLNNNAEWKFAGQTVGKEVLALPTEWSELYILVSVGSTENGYVEFTPKRIILPDAGTTLFGGRVAIGDSGKRYNRGVALNITKTTVWIAEVMYSQGAGYNATDTNVTNEAQMFVYYR